jgi:hypothetical protein
MVKPHDSLDVENTIALVDGYVDVNAIPFIMIYLIRVFWVFQ